MWAAGCLFNNATIILIGSFDAPSNSTQQLVINDIKNLRNLKWQPDSHLIAAVYELKSG